MTISASDYSNAISTIRGHLSKGTSLSANEMKDVLEVIKDSSDRFTYGTPGSEMRTAMESLLELDVGLGSEALVDAIDAILLPVVSGSTSNSIYDALDELTAIYQLDDQQPAEDIIDIIDAAVEAAADDLDGREDNPDYPVSPVADG